MRRHHVRVASTVSEFVEISYVNREGGKPMAGRPIAPGVEDGHAIVNMPVNTVVTPAPSV